MQASDEGRRLSLAGASPSSGARESPGDLLRQWRRLRGVSQLHLALDAGVSQKHVSFIESGRSTPSAQMVVELAAALGVPLRERNALLMAAGHAPRYSDAGLDAPTMSRLRSGLSRLLHQNEPYPALVMDRHWNVLFANDASPRFFQCFTDMSARPPPRNLLHLMFDPEGVRPFVLDWPATSRMLIQRVYREAPGQVVDLGTRELLDGLAGYPDADIGRSAAGAAATSPMIPLRFQRHGVTLSYFSLVTTVGTPQAIAAEELRLECMMPADDETEQRHVEFVSRHSAGQI